MKLATDLARVFERRRAINPRYSLRAFARSIGISHSAVSRILKGAQRPSAATIIHAAGRLGWDAAYVESVMRAERLERLQCTAASSEFVTDARWIASRTNLSLDEVQLALHEGLRQGHIHMTAPHTWKVTR